MRLPQDPVGRGSVLRSMRLLLQTSWRRPCTRLAWSWCPRACPAGQTSWRWALALSAASVRPATGALCGPMASCPAGASLRCMRRCTATRLRPPARWVHSTPSQVWCQYSRPAGLACTHNKACCCPPAWQPKLSWWLLMTVLLNSDLPPMYSCSSLLCVAAAGPLTGSQLLW